ncbi:cyclophilin type peptidyl-prolyl cis-trans isomerase, putative [Bodo saltans]|uniref:Cyclophilin type peptidyl-prolyl cis-trans isomerase, putative n=1 Tax=Bodo saltans TaxID=75058 RepID=A0A0S4JEH9_BODSA|nr:cyclophilin type peptidyl-prolyl cis-trans isomerase, putative [Bodo saltans]|eukprot:CUG88574.1 cyclophilin type peptidyl-prolyl cis-trans isomerase, putative [Bodo saltans]
MCNSGPNTNGSQFFICCLPRIVSTATQQQPSDAVGNNDATPATDGDSNATPSALPADSSSPPTSSTTTSVVTSAAYLDSRQVAFGRLMEGSEDVLHRLLEEIQPYVAGGAGGEFDDSAAAGSIDIQSPFSIGAIGPL